MGRTEPKKSEQNFLLGGPSVSASSCSSSLAGCFLLLAECGGDVGACDGPGSSLVSMAMRNESMSSFMKSSVGCSVSGCFVLDLPFFFGCESSDSVARTKLASRTLSDTLRITGLKHNHIHTHERIQ